MSDNDDSQRQGLLVGTRKGLFVLTHDDHRKWSSSEPHSLGHVMQHVVADRRPGGVILAATRTGHLGPTVLRSSDMGATWQESTKPPAFHTDEALARAVDAVFWLTPGHDDEPGAWYAGATPQGLFRSDDHGDTWAPVDGWNDHPMWETWAEFPHMGTPDGAMLHSINVDPRDPEHLYIGLSGGGVFESTDGGADWRPLNRGIEADFLPNPEAGFGHDPHCVRVHPAMPDRLYQQNHCGIYRMDRPDETWIRIGDNMAADVGDIGFPIEVHPRDPDTAWVFPMDGTEVWPRTSPDGRPAVYVTHDAGSTWIRQDVGLPERGWLTVKRQAMATDAGDPVGVYFGTTGGEVWASDDEGESWTCIAQHLPEIFSVEVAYPSAS
jgi:photosystem II stability/assembly factor-like uncharacterized protein